MLETGRVVRLEAAIGLEPEVVEEVLEVEHTAELAAARVFSVHFEVLQHEAQYGGAAQGVLEVAHLLLLLARHLLRHARLAFVVIEKCDEGLGSGGLPERVLHVHRGEEWVAARVLPLAVPPLALQVQSEPILAPLHALPLVQHGPHVIHRLLQGHSPEVDGLHVVVVRGLGLWLGDRARRQERRQALPQHPHAQVGARSVSLEVHGGRHDSHDLPFALTGRRCCGVLQIARKALGKGDELFVVVTLAISKAFGVKLELFLRELDERVELLLYTGSPSVC
mmetsp:Transcript_29216/g.58699  ORF Transcript_29216/g.58699 Transcript_29216/m.58699 type:complete len:280 (+) Transcript_29216:643-1482(+)